MSRWINADALKESWKEIEIDGATLSVIYGLLKSVDDAPSIDIVRCKECKWCLVDEGGCERIGMVLFADEIENHFCGYGERKESER